jgi:hypothetical protein
VGRREMVQKIQEYETQYDEVMVSNALDFPYIFYLYYAPISPQEYLELGGTVSGGFTEQNNKVKKVQFRSISPAQIKPFVKTLFIGLPSEVFPKAIIEHTIEYPDGTPAIVFFR